MTSKIHAIHGKENGTGKWIAKKRKIERNHRIIKINGSKKQIDRVEFVCIYFLCFVGMICFDEVLI